MLFVITPIRNEQNTIVNFIQQLAKLHLKLHLVLVIDDYSTDQTKSIIEQLNMPWITLLHAPTKGLAQAYLHGLKYARNHHATKVVELDVGHPIHLLPIFNISLDYHDIVFASRYLPQASYQGPYLRQAISRIGTELARRWLHLPFTDCTSGYQGFTQAVLNKLPLDQFLSKGHIYQTEMKFYCAKLKFVELPINYQSGQSSLNIRGLLEGMTLFFKLRTRRYLQVTSENSKRNCH